MTPAEIETLYEALARQLDAVGVDRHALYLAKLALLLARELGDMDKAQALIADAARSLDA